jgi:hypothetical protein
MNAVEYHGRSCCLHREANDSEEGAGSGEIVGLGGTVAAGSLLLLLLMLLQEVWWRVNRFSAERRRDSRSFSWSLKSLLSAVLQSFAIVRITPLLHDRTLRLPTTAAKPLVNTSL